MEEKTDILKKNVNTEFKQKIPSVDFTAAVMQKVEHSLIHKAEIKPLISRKAWTIIIAVFAAIILGTFLTEAYQLKSNWIESFPRLEDFGTTIKTFLRIVLIGSILILLDIIYRLRKKALALK